MSPAGGKAITPDFIEQNTVLTPAPLVPELRLHLATEATPLWEATEAALEENDLPPPFWAFPWAGGQALARYVIDNAELVAGRRILDFGAGSGIAGLGAAWASAATVIGNDTDPTARIVMEMNAEANGFQDRFRAEIRDMLDEPALADDGGPLFDVILAADVFYERTMASRTLAWLQRHAEAGALVLIGDPGRSFQPKTGLARCAAYDVPVSRALEDTDVRHTSVWRLEKSGAS